MDGLGMAMPFAGTGIFIKNAAITRVYHDFFDTTS
jgi:hypothetical protein